MPAPRGFQSCAHAPRAPLPSGPDAPASRACPSWIKNLNPTLLMQTSGGNRPGGGGLYAPRPVGGVKARSAVYPPVSTNGRNGGLFCIKVETFVVFYAFCFFDYVVLKQRSY